nr:MAG: hypothetical protein [Mononegavirales sp.]
MSAGRKIRLAIQPVPPVEDQAVITEFLMEAADTLAVEETGLGGLITGVPEFPAIKPRAPTADSTEDDMPMDGPKWRSPRQTVSEPEPESDSSDSDPFTFGFLRSSVITNRDNVVLKLEPSTMLSRKDYKIWKTSITELTACICRFGEIEGTVQDDGRSITLTRPLKRDPTPGPSRRDPLPPKIGKTAAKQKSPPSRSRPTTKRKPRTSPPRASRSPDVDLMAALPPVDDNLGVWEKHAIRVQIQNRTEGRAPVVVTLGQFFRDKSDFVKKRRGFGVGPI